MKEIRIEIVPDTSHQRYDTLDDYWLKDDVLTFRITKQSEDWKNLFILIHAMIEYVLTSEKGITEKEITDFDIEFEKDEKRVKKYWEPGMDKNAPYHKEHKIALKVEQLMCKHLGINFKQYNDSFK